MKIALLLLLNLLLAPPVHADNVPLNVVVDGIDQPSGCLVVQVYNADNWLSDQPLQSQSLPLPADYQQGALSIALELPAGRYAFSVYHDVDGNGQMNKNAFGLPAEPVGLSNRHVPRFGPPRYRKAEVSITADTGSIYITLN